MWDFKKQNADSNIERLYKSAINLIFKNEQVSTQKLDDQL